MREKYFWNFVTRRKKRVDLQGTLAKEWKGLLTVLVFLCRWWEIKLQTTTRVEFGMGVRENDCCCMGIKATDVTTCSPDSIIQCSWKNSTSDIIELRFFLRILMLGRWAHTWPQKAFKFGHFKSKMAAKLQSTTQIWLKCVQNNYVENEIKIQK